MEEKTSYKNIFKATSLFGGVQVIQVILNLIRGKVIAVLLGASGMGINSLFVSSISMISNISGLGLNFSAVRDISKSQESGNIEKLSRTLKIYLRWLYASTFIGFLAVVALSPILSKVTFNSNQYIWAFMLLAFMLVFNALAAGNTSILQGTRSLKAFAKQSVAGSIVAMVVSIPLYYFFGIKAIVPALIFSALVTYIFSIYYTSKVKTVNVSVSRKETLSGGMDMVKLGVTMMVATFIGTFVNYLINTYISNTGSLADLGFYQAGMSITAQSIGLVFTAMAIDYYPRLSAVSDNNSKVKEMVNQQAEMTLLIATPILLVLILTTPLVIQILLTKEFMPIVGFIRTLAFGMFFKAASYSIGAISFAKGDKKVFFFLEGVYTNASLLVFNVIGFLVGGLSGLAYSFLIMHIIYFILINVVTSRRYDYSMSGEFKRVMLTQLIMMATAFAFFVFIKGIVAYLLASVIFLFSLYYTYTQLDKILGIKEFINTKILRRK